MLRINNFDHGFAQCVVHSQVETGSSMKHVTDVSFLIRLDTFSATVVNTARVSREKM